MTTETIDNFDCISATDTVERLCKVTAILCDPNEVTEHLAQLDEVLTTSHSRNNKLADKLTDVCNEAMERARLCSSLLQVQIESD